MAKYCDRSAVRAASLCLLLLVLALGPNTASGKGILSQLGNLMTDSPNGNGALVDDAATGTVQDLDAKQAASCDGQLAVALVQANDLATAARKERDEALEKHGESLATIAGLEKDLEHTKMNLGKEIADLTKIKDTRDEVIQEEKDRAAKELEEAKTKAQQEYEALRDEKDATLKTSEEAAAKTLESTKQTAAEEYQSLKEEKDAEITSLEAKLRMSNEELEATMRSELEKAKLEKETKVAAITADRDDTVAKLTESMKSAATAAAEILQKTKYEAAATIASLEADRDAKIAALTQDMETTIASLEADRDAKVTALTQDMETAAKTAAQILQTTKDEAKAFLKDQLAAKNDEADKAKLAYEEQLAAKNQKIQKLQEYTEQMLEKKAATERYLEEATTEITHWRDLHAHRSYCNMTHVATDLYDVGLVVYAESVKQVEVARDLAMAHVSEGVEKSKRFVHGQVDEHWPVIQPYYEEHVANNYKTHLEPHMKNHVFPMLNKGYVWFQRTIVPMVIRAMEDIKKSYQTKIAPIIEAKHQGAVDTYGYYCKLYLREFKKASTESDVLKSHPPPAYLLESWKTSCAQPRESLGALTNGTLTVLALIFYRRILGLVWWIATFSLSLVIMPLRWTPLGWFLPRPSVVVSEVTDDVDQSAETPPAVEHAFSASPMSEAKTESKGYEDTKMDGFPPAAKLKLY